jgi:hypothetical protein
MKMYSGEKNKENAASCASKPENPNRKEVNGLNEDRTERYVAKIGKEDFFTKLYSKGISQMNTSENQSEKNAVETEVDENVETETQFAEGVIEEPRNEEEMHLKYIKHSPSLVDVYLAVSDDEGKLLDDEELNVSVTTFIETYKAVKVGDVPDAEAVVKELQALYQTYSTKINRADSISEGVITKYRIRQGMLLNIEKKLLRKKDKQWITHFNNTYGDKGLRSAQDYMKLGRTPNIIRYAVYGKERLMEILRAIKELDIDTEDPIASFLDHYSIPFNTEDPDSDEKLVQLKWQIDTAVAMTKIQKAEVQKELELGLNPDLVKKIVEHGIKVENGLIKDLFIIKNANGDVNSHLEDLYLNGGEGDGMLGQIKSVTGLPKLAAGLKDTVNYILGNVTLVERIDSGAVKELEKWVLELKGIVENGIITE